MSLIETIKKLVPGLTDEQYAQIEAVLALALGEEVKSVEGEPPAEGEAAPPPAEGKSLTEADLKTAVAEAVKTLGFAPAPKPAPKTPARPPYAFKSKGEGAADGDEDDPTLQAKSAIKSVAMLRFGGETPAAIKAVTRDLYGEDYEVKRHQQHLAFAKFLRHGEIGLERDERAALKTIYLVPSQLKAMILGGANVLAIKTDLAETVDSLGGFTVPEDLRLEMLERLPGMTVVRARADVTPTSSDVMTRITVTGGDTRHTGAMRVTWVGDTPVTSQAVTNPTFGTEKTPIHIAMCTVRVPRSLLEDTAVPLAAKVGEWASQEYAIDEDEQFLVGNGIAKPQGILPGSANGLSLNHIASGDASTWPAANVVDTLMQIKYKVARQYRDECVWIMNDTTAGYFSRVQDGMGRPIWYNSMREGEPDRLLGYPALTSEAMPDIAANAFPILFGDLRGYQIADRVGMTLTRDELTESEADIVKFVFRRRLGGQVAQTYRFAALEIAAS